MNTIAETKEKYSFYNIHRQHIHTQEVSQNFLQAIEDFKSHSQKYNAGRPMPVYFDHISKFPLILYSPEEGEVNLATLGYDIQGDKCLAVYLSQINPIDEVTAAHEVAHDVLYAREYLHVKSRSNEGGRLILTLASTIEHFAVNQYLRDHNLSPAAAYKEQATKAERQGRYSNLSVDELRERALFLIDICYNISRLKRKWVERETSKRNPEIYRYYVEIRNLINKMPSAARVTPEGNLKLMEDILQLWGFESEYIVYNPMEDYYYSYAQLRGPGCRGLKRERTA